MKPFFLFALALAPLASLAQTLSTTSGTTLTVQSGATLYVSGGVQHASGATLTNAGTVQLTGDLANAGTLTSPGTLLFSGSQDQTFTPGAATVSNLTLRNTGAAGNNRLFVPQDLTVSSLLTLTKGLVRTQGSSPGSPLATLRLPAGASVAGETDGQYVQGRLQVARLAVNATTGPVDFSNGLVLNPNGQNLGAVSVTRTAGLQAAGVSYGQNLGGTAKGIDRVWQVEASQPPSAATPAAVQVSWVADDDNGINLGTAAQLWRADQASGPWLAQGAPASINARTFKATVTQLGVLTVSNTSAPLPVTLVTFTAERQGADGLLRWSTASELNNAYFQVESAVDGTTFQPLGRVAGAGTSSQAHAYQYLDANLARYAVAQVYYRLRQVDTNGADTYSPVRAVAVPLAAGLLVQAYPNPSQPAAAEVSVAIRTDQAGPATLVLINALGQLVGQQQAELPAGASNWPLAAARQLAPGVYVLRVQQGSQRQSLKLVRQ